MPSLVADLAQDFRDIPALDIHTHLSGGRLGARGLHDIVLYHMVISDLYAAGCPDGARLTEFPGWPEKAECHRRLERAIPYLPGIRNTSCWWGARMILEDLYGWKDEITADNWRRLDDLIRERADDGRWHREVLDRAAIARTCAEYARRGTNQDDDRLQYAIEWGMFTRTQWGEYDTALYDLERTWGRAPESPCAIGAGPRPATDKVIRSLADVHAAIAHYVDTLPYGEVVAKTIGISTDIDWTVPSDDAMERAIARRANATVADRDIYAAYIWEHLLRALTPRADRILMQFSLGAEPLPHETMCRVDQRTLAQLAECFARHPRIRFQCMNADRGAHQGLCTMVRELPNFSLAGFWWHSFFPNAIRQTMEERLDMVPLAKQCGFFSDAYCVEWSYAKSRIVRQMMAEVYAGKVASGQYSRAQASSVARAVLFETPQSLNGMRPRAAHASAGR